MGRGKTCVCCLAVFAGLLGTLWLLLVCSAAIPNEAIRTNMEKSALTYKNKDPFSFENGRRWSGISDNYADSILLNVSWNMGRGEPILSSLDTWYFDGGALGENGGLYLSVTNPDTEPNVDYSRYWHGSAIFVRLLHLVTDVEGVKAAGFVAAVVLGSVTMAVLAGLGHKDLAAALALSLAAVRVWNIRLSLEYEPAFVICFLLCPAFLWAERRKEEYLGVLSLAAGVLIAFFDFLTTETVVLLVPLTLVAAVRALEGRLGSFWENLSHMGQWGLCWLVGYGGTFLAKWTAASVASGENRFLAAFSSAQNRLGGTLVGQGPDNLLIRMPMAVAANLTVFFGGTARVEFPRVGAGLVAVFFCLGSYGYLFYKNNKNHWGTQTVLLLGSMVFLRYMVLSNHSYLHEFFTYRALVSPVLAVLSAVVLETRRHD